jgi:hypothetical protein
MRLVVENTEDGIFDVTSMYDAKGNETTNKFEAESIVIKVNDGFVTAEVHAPEHIHTVH